MRALPMLSVPALLPRPRWRGALWAGLAALALVLSGCVTTQQTAKPIPVRTNPVIAEASALARNHDALQGQARSENAAAIQRLLGGLDDATLASEAAALPQGSPLYNFAGRELLRRNLPLPRPFDREGNWRFRADNRAPADRDGYRPPRKLAVLLPLTGNLATAASPVRDGLLAGYFGEFRQRPDIVFYDTLGTPAGAVEAYRRAAGDGADYVLGPLGRDEVAALFREELNVPVLALNRAAAAPPSGSASFALAPEDDGIAAAEYAVSRRARRVLVLAGSEDSQQRSANAFREHLLSRGGTVAGSVAVGEKPEDAIAALQAAVAAAQASGGIDAVFFALKGGQARALAPTLTAAGLNTKLRVATSQLLSGTGKAEQDLLLDGIAFPSETWSVRGLPGLPPAEQTGKTLPTARGAAAKLFAFGYDAWLLTAYLDKLANGADGKLEGATGTLRLDGFGNVQRAPAWSSFSNGVITGQGGQAQGGN